MFKLFSAVKLAGISAFMTVVNFLILLHKAVVAFYRVMRGEQVVPIDYDPQPNTPPDPTPPLPPKPDNNVPLPFPINIIWDTVTDIITDHIFNNLFGSKAQFKSNYYSRQWLLDFIRNDPELQVRIAEVLKDICKIDNPSDTPPIS